jgi:hypothetical protein
MQELKPNAFVPADGDMKIQLSSTTMAWVDRTGNILHQWKRTKRGTRGGKNRRQEEFRLQTPRGSVCPTPRGMCCTPRAGPHNAAQETQGSLSKTSSSQEDHGRAAAGTERTSARRQDSDCSSSSECHVDGELGDAGDASHVESAHTPPLGLSELPEVETVSNGDNEFSDEMAMPDPGSASPHEMAELITRLYGLVNVLQNDNEQVCHKP